MLLCLMRSARYHWLYAWSSRQTHLPFRIGIFSLLVMLYFPIPTSSQNLGAVNPYKVKAAFLRNFTHYVVWPEKVFSDSHSPWRICVLGRDPFGEILDKTLKGRLEQGRPFSIHRASTLDRLPKCQIIYITYYDSAKRLDALSALKGQAVLTVGEADEFLWEGGMIQLQEKERLKLSINLDQTQSSGLVIPTKLLEVSHQVLRKGSLIFPTR